jgi:hypothetical protein
MQIAKAKKGAQDSAATEEAALRLANGTWPAFRALSLGHQVVRRNRAYFAATGGLSLAAFAGFHMISRGPAPGPEAQALCLAALAGLGHALAIERTQRDLLGEPERPAEEVIVSWCLRIPALLGVVALVVATVSLLDLTFSPLLNSAGGLVAFLAADLLVRFTGFPVHEVVAGERNPLAAFVRGARLAGFPLRAAAARMTQWSVLLTVGWALAACIGMVGGAWGQVTWALRTNHVVRDALQALGAVVLVPLGVLIILYWISWVQTSWAAYYLLRKEERECVA